MPRMREALSGARFVKQEQGHWLWL